MHAARLQRVRERLAAAGLDALLVTSLPNVYYLSGFTGTTASVVVTRERAWFLTDFRYHEQFSEQVPACFTLVDNTGQPQIQEVLAGLADGSALRRVGFESRSLSYAAFSRLAAGNGMAFVPTDGWIEELRLIKDESEVERLRASVRLNERIFREILELIGPEVTEAELAAEIHYRALKLGAQGYSFTPIIASGERAARPHAGFSNGRLAPGRPLTIDQGLRLNGYCSDMTRTVFYRDCPPQWERIYSLVREAKQRTFAALKPGLEARAADAVARELIYSAGYEGKFEHGVGHGVGIEIKEPPRLFTDGELMLKAGMVFTTEPGIYLPGEGGVRIEDMVVLREDGAENLNELSTELLVVG